KSLLKMHSVNKTVWSFLIAVSNLFHLVATVSIKVQAQMTILFPFLIVSMQDILVEIFILDGMQSLWVAVISYVLSLHAISVVRLVLFYVMTLKVQLVLLICMEILLIHHTMTASSMEVQILAVVMNAIIDAAKSSQMFTAE